jgi:hypothetical protein
MIYVLITLAITYGVVTGMVVFIINDEWKSGLCSLPKFLANIMLSLTWPVWLILFMVKEVIILFLEKIFGTYKMMMNLIKEKKVYVNKFNFKLIKEVLNEYIKFISDLFRR